MSSAKTVANASIVDFQTAVPCFATKQFIANPYWIIIVHLH
jgi:hypothetical protein